MESSWLRMSWPNEPGKDRGSTLAGQAEVSRPGDRAAALSAVPALFPHGAGDLCRIHDLIEPFGLDEAWIDVTGSGVFGDAVEIAETIRNRVKFELGITVSIGVSFNKIFAKLGSDYKKPDAVTVFSKGRLPREGLAAAGGGIAIRGAGHHAKITCAVHPYHRRSGADRSVAAP